VTVLAFEIILARFRSQFDHFLVLDCEIMFQPENFGSLTHPTIF